MIHGNQKLPVYRHPLGHIYKGMLFRCLNPNSKDYARYGGRGITVCGRWTESFAAFVEDMSPRPSLRHSIDREDNFGPYSPENCRWATVRGQARNRRTNRVIEHDGRAKLLTEWAEEVGLRIDTLHHRLGLGWDFAKAIGLPARREDGSRRSRTKLSYGQVSQIRRLHSQGASMKSLATAFGVAGPSVRKVVLRESHSYVPEGYPEEGPGGESPVDALALTAARRLNLSRPGEKAGNNKLSEIQAKEIKRRGLAGETPTRLGREFGVAANTAYGIRTGKQWRHLS